MACAHCKGWGVNFKEAKFDKPQLFKLERKKGTKSNPIQCKHCSRIKKEKGDK